MSAIKQSVTGTGNIVLGDYTLTATATGTVYSTGNPQVNITGNAATVTTNANLSGVVTSVGNTTSIANGAITNAMLANAAVANLSGTNTGDNAVNSLYSGLVSNATHTGDVTGSTALTLATTQSAVHTWSATQTFSVAPVFTDASGTRTALGLGALATVTPGAGVTTELARPLLASTASSASAVTLTVASARTQEVTTGSANQVFNLPLVNTLVAIGWETRFVNNSTYTCAVKINSGASTVITLAPKQSVTLINDSISTESTASWRIVGLAPMPFAAAKDSGSAQALTSASVNAYVPVEFPTAVGGDSLTASNTTWTAKVDGVVELTFSCVLSSLLNPAYDNENLFVFAGYKLNSSSEVDVLSVAPPVWTNINGTNLSYLVNVSVPISVAAGDTLQTVVQLSVTDGSDFDFTNRFFRVKYINPTP